MALKVSKFPFLICELVLKGSKFPLGVSVAKSATNFAVYCDSYVNNVKLHLFYGMETEPCFSCVMVAALSNQQT